MSVSLEQVEELLSAARSGNQELVGQLIHKETHLNSATNYDGISALHVACAAGDLGMVQFLISKGANVNNRNVDGATALGFACNRGLFEIAKLLIQNGAQTDLACQINTPLHDAASNGHVQCINLLLQNGAQLEVCDCWLGTPLHNACYRGQGRAAKVLLDAGASINARMIHRTPLHYAVQQHPSNVALSALLLIYGANIHAQNNSGISCYDMAPVNSELRDFFIRWGAYPRTLQEYCRREVLLARNEAIGEQAKGLPMALQSYLNCEDLLN